MKNLSTSAMRIEIIATRLFIPILSFLQFGSNLGHRGGEETEETYNEDERRPGYGQIDGC